MTTLIVRASAAANAISPFRRIFFLATIAIVALVGTVVWQASHFSARTLFVIIGLSFFSLVWTWGLFLLSTWFGPAVRFRPPAKAVVAAFLLLWFIVGSTGSIAFTVSVLLEPGA